MRSRLPFAIAAIVAVCAAAAALALLVRDEKPAPVGLPVGSDGYAARASFSPRSQLFGQPVVARVELLLDRAVIDPSRVAVVTRFDPFTPAGETRETRTDYDRYTRLRFEYALDCLVTNCVPETLTKDIQPAAAVIRHAGQPIGVVEWPTVTIGSRVGDFAAQPNNPSQQPSLEVPWRATLRIRPPTFSLDPALMTTLLAAFALVLLGGSLYFVQVAFPGAPIGFRRLRRVRLTPIERALAVLERAHAQGIEREQRLALDRLAHELRTGGQVELAGTARRLAWEPPVPDAERTATLSGRVRSVIDGRSNGGA